MTGFAQKLSARKWLRSKWMKGLLATGIVYFGVTGLDLEDRIYAQILEHTTAADDKVASVWLHDFKADIDGVELKGVEDDLSGLTWNKDTKTLFAPLNGNDKVVEISPDGEVLRTIIVRGFGDIEAITWIGGDHYLLTEERTMGFIKVEIDSATTEVNIEDSHRVRMGLDAGDNVGFEGVAWEPQSKAAFVVKEKEPMMLYRFYGIDELGFGKEVNLHRDEVFTAGATKVSTDLSGLFYDESTKHLLVLSDESKLVTELDNEGQVVSYMELEKGWHGLSMDIPQAEGVAMDDDGNLYVVSEPNLFYRFSKSTDQS